MSKVDNKGNGRFPFGWLKGSQTKREISGYHVENVESQKHIIITVGSTLVGNVTAPSVTVDGQLYGTAVATRVHIHSKGQVWGDVYATELSLEPGGKLAGWFTTTHAAGLEEMEAALSDASATEAEEAADESGMGHLTQRDPEEIQALRLLRGETAVALAARAELEQTFDKRVSEVVGQASTELQTLRNRLEALQDQREELESEVAEYSLSQDAQGTRLDQQAGELDIARDLLVERQQTIEVLQVNLEGVSTTNDQLQDQLVEYGQELIESRKEVDKQGERLRSLESALQGSLQHTSEQEESLIRWQELAETHEDHVKELESELDSTRLELVENASKAESRHGAEAEVLEFEGGDTALIAELAMLQEESEATEMQFLWYKANLETSRLDLEASEQAALGQNKLLARLQTDLDAQQAQADKWKAGFEKIARQLHQIKKQKQNGNQTLLSEKEAAETTVAEVKQQLFISEAENEQHQIEFETQGQSLAELRSTLVERDLKAQQLEAQLVEQESKLEQQANLHIEEVETFHQQIRDLKRVVERRTKG